MMSRLSLLLRERAGNVTIELALLAPLLGAMLIGLIDISTAFSDKLRLEQVAQRTIEKVMQNSFLVSQAPTLKAEAEAEAGAGAVATVSWWLECDGEIQTPVVTAYTLGCPEGEQYGRYVQISITRDYTPLILSTLAGSNMDDDITLTGVAGIRIQ
jgi:Flp pilus assembly protein TadG